MTQIELLNDVIALIKQKRVIAVLEDGQLKLYATIHATPEMKNRALPPSDVKRLWINGDAG